MTIRDILITGKSAKLPGDYAPATDDLPEVLDAANVKLADKILAARTIDGKVVRPVTEAEIRHKAQFEPGGVHPAALVIPQAPVRSLGTTLGAKAGELRLELPWPPSINSYWQLGVNPKTKQRLLKMSAQGRLFNRAVKLAVRRQFDAAPIECRVAVLIELFAPTSGPYGNNGFDVDNRVKPLLDALTKAGLWTDDKIVRDVRIVDRGRCAGGRVVVWIRPI